MQDRQTAQGIHSIAAIELFTSQPHIAAHFSCWKAENPPAGCLMDNQAVISREGYWFPPGCVSENKLALIHENWQDFYIMCFYTVCEAGCISAKRF